MPIQRFDVLQDVPESHFGGSDFLGSQPVKHEGVVGIRAMGADNFLGRDGCHKVRSPLYHTDGCWLLVVGYRECITVFGIWMGDGNQLPPAGETACPTYFAKR